MAVGITKMHPGAWRVIEFIGRQVVTELVATVIGEPQLTGLRLPIETDAITHTKRIDFDCAAIGIHAHDIGKALRIGIANVAGGAHRNIELAVRTESNEFPPMVGLAGQPLGNRHGGGRIFQASLDVVITQDAVHRRHIKTALLVGYADRKLQPAGNQHHALCLEIGAKAHCMHFSRLHRADEKRSALAVVTPERHLSGVVDACPKFNGKAWRQLDMLQRQLGGCRQSQRNQCQSKSNKDVD